MADEESPDPKPKRRDKAALPFSEDTEKLDGRAWTRKPLVVLAVVVAVVAVIVAFTLAGKDLTSNSDDGGSGGVPPVPTTTTTAPPRTTSTTTTTTTAPPATTEPTGPQPGDPCSPEEGSPDCIDPEGDGNSTLITGGAACLETADDPLQCADNDNDGDAGPAVIPT